MLDETRFVYTLLPFIAATNLFSLLSVVQMKEASPPALPLDSSETKGDMSSLETLLENLLQEVEAKKKRDAQGLCLLVFGSSYYQ